MEGGGCQIVAYADDVAVIFSGKYPQTLCDLMTVKLKKLATWGDKCDLGCRDLHPGGYPPPIDFWNDHPTGHSSILLDRGDIPPKTDYCLPTEHTPTPFRTLIPRREEWTAGPPANPGALSFYTDGSKLNNQVGGGAFSQQLGVHDSFRLPDHCSVFQAEILAINEALTLLKNSNTTSSTIRIYISKCRKSLHEMAEHFDICLIWVPGHRDIPGNCIADESCRDDKEDESPQHFFCSCSALSKRRLRILGKPFLDNLSNLAAVPPPKIALFIQLSNWTPF
ncbi:hypothetical protein ACLKA7_005662 [Drosophila subpalustris]